MTTRREFLLNGAAAGVVGLVGEAALAKPLPPMSPVGIASAAMGKHRDGLGVIAPMGEDSMAYVEYCRSLGAGGLQFTAVGDLKRLRRRMEELGMWYEGNARAPGSLAQDTAEFEQSLRNTREMGGNVARYVSRRPPESSGRRYSSFTSLDEFNAWRDEANAIVLKCLPIAERIGVKLALENHKDRLVDEHVEFLRSTSSEYLGALVDPGNNLSMLETPEEVCTKLAPYVLSVSMKDMGVAPYAEGFLLSEVRFGTGVTDQKALWKILKSGNPNLNCLEEIITRDPLQVPCLTERYWASLPEYRADQLASHMEWVRSNASELPYVSQLSPAEQLQAEEDNNRDTLEWGRINIA
ncbi:MAG: TIM barrel protein [Gammaproteobacteria bacterium]|nr:TIM barrel protein [Gammaproteobacteria bacterium]